MEIEIRCNFFGSRIKIKSSCPSVTPLPKNGQTPEWRPENGPLSGQMATCQKTKVIQSYLRIWGTYDPIGLDPYDPQKRGLYRCSVKNEDFWTKNEPWWALMPPVQWVQNKKTCLFVSGHDGDKNLDDVAKNGFWAKKLHFWPKNHFFLHYACIAHLFPLRRT